MVNEIAHLPANDIVGEEVFFRPLAEIGGYRLILRDSTTIIVINDDMSHHHQALALKELRQSTETFELLYANELGIY